MNESIRKYKHVLSYLNPLTVQSEQKVEEVYQSVRVNSVRVETQNAVQFPDYTATKINILV